MTRARKWAIALGVLVLAGTIMQSVANRTANLSPPSDTPTDRAPSSGPATIVDSAIVWKDRDAMERGTNLLTSGAYRANPELLVPHIACIVAPGTAVTVIARTGMGRREIAVDDGPHRGCTGVVPMERVRTR